MTIILQKIIAASGYSSRRKAEELVRAGRVKVNGQTAVIGDQADPDKDLIAIDGRVLAAAAAPIYVKLNKPESYTCTNRRFNNEKNIFDLINLPERLFAVGRLDKGSRGLILLTNDGALAQRLTHPRFQHEKIYEVRVREKIGQPESILAKFRRGVEIGEGDGVVRVKDIKYLQNGLFIITLSEGKKRQIRRMFKALGLTVGDLKRTNLAGLELDGLKEGSWARLSLEEIKKLKKGEVA
ncbi:MAG: pseudouridine synthase [Patescibacteria group bacterium]